VAPEYLAIIMLAVSIALVIAGCRVAFALAGAALFFGVFSGEGGMLLSMFPRRVFDNMSSISVQAVTCFVLMGAVLETSGVAAKFYDGLYLLIGRLRGGLLYATMIIATAFAACTGVVGASVVAIGLIGLPSMLKRGYDKSLVAGTICTGGGLDVIIPPSILLILYGSVAGTSIAELFFAAIIPGLIMSGLYITYIAVRTKLNPQLAPALPPEESEVPFRKAMRLLAVSVLPTGGLIVAVLGSIFFGVAAPTEAASVGAVVALLILIAYGKFNLQNLVAILKRTLSTIGMAMFIVVCASFFTTVFMGLGGGDLVKETILNVGGGKAGAIAMMLGIVVIMGMFMDWIAILYIVVPLYSPVVAMLGIDPLWFAIMYCIALKISYTTPPFAYAVFFLRGIAPPEVSVVDIYKGVYPYVLLDFVAILLVYFFPILPSWLPNLMKV